MAPKERVLVTGRSGFLGSYCIIETLKHGYNVRTTIRSLKRVDDVKQMLQHDGISRKETEGVDFVEADLSENKGWLEACKNCLCVLHVASPLPLEVPKDPDVVMKPAVDGILRVLKAAKEAGSVNRVVLTSKTLAERAAWDYASAQGGDMELSVINPGGIFGRVLSKDYAASMEIIVRLINGQLPGCPKLYISMWT